MAQLPFGVGRFIVHPRLRELCPAAVSARRIQTLVEGPDVMGGSGPSPYSEQAETPNQPLMARPEAERQDPKEEPGAPEFSDRSKATSMALLL